jgi:hypothetical protein
MSATRSGVDGLDLFRGTGSAGWGCVTGPAEREALAAIFPIHRMVGF